MRKLIMCNTGKYIGNCLGNGQLNGAITFALILQKFRLRLSYTCAHKSGAFALSFGVTLAPIFSQLFLGQLLVFEPCYPCPPTWRWKSSNRFTQSLKSQVMIPNIYILRHL